MKLIKDFVYPEKYTFKRFTSDMTIEDKIKYIKNDLEDVYFNEQIGVCLSGLLEDYFPSKGILNIYLPLSQQIFIRLKTLMRSA